LARGRGEAHGARPIITYFDLMMVLDNETGTVTEWSESGEKRSHA
jgi:hypothetical protein